MKPKDTASEANYFFVKVWINKTAHIYGPYLQMAQAVDMLIDHTSKIALPKESNKRFDYKAEIQEHILTKDGAWKKIETHIIENPCTVRGRV